MFKKIFFKFFLAILISIAISNFLIKEVFIANSPIIRPNLGKYLSNKFLPKDLFDKINKNNNNVEDIKNNNINENLVFSKIDKKNFVPLSKGVYANNFEKNARYVVISNDQVDWVEYTFEIEGKKVKIKIPKGQPTPTQDILKLMKE